MKTLFDAYAIIWWEYALLELGQIEQPRPEVTALIEEITKVNRAVLNACEGIVEAMDKFPDSEVSDEH